MAKLSTKFIFPDWLPSGLKEHVIDVRGKVQSSLAERDVENRLLTDLRMKPVWGLFKNLPDDKGKQLVIEFLDIAGVISLDAQEMKVTKKEQAKIRSLKATITRRFQKLIDISYFVDEFCSGSVTKKLVKQSELLGELSNENQLIKIRDDLVKQLDFFNRSTQPRIRMFIRNKKEVDILLTIRKRSQDNFVDIFTREAVSIFFKQWFNQPYSALAEDVALVMSGTPKGRNVTRKQQHDRTRKRRAIARSRSKK